MLKNTIPFLLLLSSVVWSFDDVSHTGVLNKVYPDSIGRVVLYFDNDHPQCKSGTNPDYYYLAVNTLSGVTQEAFDAMFSTALMAASMRKAITITFDTSTKYCYVREMSINF
jgi:hypothetical protein